MALHVSLRLLTLRDGRLQALVDRVQLTALVLEGLFQMDSGLLQFLKQRLERLGSFAQFLVIEDQVGRLLQPVDGSLQFPALHAKTML